MLEYVAFLITLLWFRFNAAIGSFVWGSTRNKRSKQYDDTVEHVSATSKSKTTDLSPIDVQQSRFTMTFGYLFNTPLNKQKLLASLQKLLTIYPQIGGVLIPKGHLLENQHENPSVEITFTRQLVPAPNAQDQYTEFKKYHCEEVPKDFPITPNQKLVSICVTTFSDQKTFLSVCLNHGVTDAQGFTRIMQSWGELYRGQTISEEPYVKTLEIQNKGPVTDEQALQSGWYDEIFVHNMYNTLKLMSMGCVMKHYYFSKNEIETYKKRIAQESGYKHLQGRIVSTNDILCALFWRTMAQCNKHVLMDEQFSLIFTLNYRTKYPNVPANYLANAITHVYLSLPKKKLLQLELSQLVLLVRNAVDEYDQKKIEHSLNYFDQKLLKYGYIGLADVGSYELRNGILITNFTKFDAYRTQFEDFPERFVLPPTSMPNIHTVINQKSGGIEWIMSATKEASEELDKIDIKNL
jgi:hypothetical protein